MLRVIYILASFSILSHNEILKLSLLSEMFYPVIENYKEATNVGWSYLVLINGMFISVFTIFYFGQ